MPAPGHWSIGQSPNSNGTSPNPEPVGGSGPDGPLSPPRLLKSPTGQPRSAPRRAPREHVRAALGENPTPAANDPETVCGSSRGPPTGGITEKRSLADHDVAQPRRSGASYICSGGRYRQHSPASWSGHGCLRVGARAGARARRIPANLARRPRGSAPAGRWPPGSPTTPGPSRAMWLWPGHTKEKPPPPGRARSARRCRTYCASRRCSLLRRSGPAVSAAASWRLPCGQHERAAALRRWRWSRLTGTPWRCTALEAGGRSVLSATTGCRSMRGHCFLSHLIRAPNDGRAWYSIGRK
jgi:hypothetical protein